MDLPPEHLDVLRSAARSVAKRLGGHPDEHLGFVWEIYSKAITHFVPGRAPLEAYIIVCCIRRAYDELRKRSLKTVSIEEAFDRTLAKEEPLYQDELHLVYDLARINLDQTDRFVVYQRCAGRTNKQLSSLYKSRSAESLRYTRALSILREAAKKACA